MAYIAANCADCSSGTPCGCCSPVSVTDSNGGAIDYSGTYTKSGEWLGTDAFERTSPSEAWIWRDWDAFPEEGWWIISTTKGDYSDGYTQSETQAGGDDCPTDLFDDGSSIWYNIEMACA